MPRPTKVLPWRRAVLFRDDETACDEPVGEELGPGGRGRAGFAEAEAVAAFRKEVQLGGEFLRAHAEIERGRFLRAEHVVVGLRDEGGRHRAQCVAGIFRERGVEEADERGTLVSAIVVALRFFAVSNPSMISRVSPL